MFLLSNKEHTIKIKEYLHVHLIAGHPYIIVVHPKEPIIVYNFTQ